MKSWLTLFYLLVVALSVAVILTRCADAHAAQSDEADSAWEATYGQMTDSEKVSGVVLEPME